MKPIAGGGQGKAVGQWSVDTRKGKEWKEETNKMPDVVRWCE